MRKLIALILFSSQVFSSVTARAQANQSKNIEQLYADLEKINKSIDATKERVKIARDARFLPDIYFSLAEFYVDKSRYMYAIKRLENKNVPLQELDFTNEKRPKQQAIETYQNILDKFPTLPTRDRALFYMAHEYRELGNDEQMAQAYQKLVTQFQQSSYWSESQLLLGNYYFETKKDYEFALGLYRKILDRPPGPFTPLARYKMGWVYINLEKAKEAVLAFEGVLLQDKDIDISSLPEIYRKTDVRRDALIAMVRPYSDLKPEEVKQLGEKRQDPLKYFLSLSNNKVSYQRVLRNLGRRLSVKNRYVPATRAYFELLRVTNDLDTKREAVEKVYESMFNTRQRWPVNFYVDEIKNVVSRIKFDKTIPAKEREKTLVNYEIFARDVATRFHERAKTTNSSDDYKLAIHAYEGYLWTFPTTKFASLIRLNLSESYFKTSQYVRAGENYEELARQMKSAEKRKEYLDSSLQAYVAALKTPASLSRLELTRARNGLRDVGAIYLKEFPRDRAIASIRFNIGRTFYDERDFEHAVRALQVYIKAHPTGSDVRLAADLILDCYNQKEDFGGLIKAGRALVADRRLPDSTRKEINDIVKQAEYKKIQDKAGAVGSKDYAKNLLKFAEKYKGSSLGDQALYEAFISLKAKKDPRAYDPGEQLLVEHENSKYAKEVVSAMGQMALLTADFRRAAKYFEIFARKYQNDSEAKNLMKNAASIREFMGDFKAAAQNYRFLGDYEGAARVEFLAGAWSELATTSAQVGGIRGAYWSGLARYRLGDRPGATPFLTQAAKSAGNNYEEKTMAAHSLFLLSSEALKNYKSVELVQGKEADGIKLKNKMLETLTQQLNTVIQFGNGRWVIASLYALGQANREFGDFLRRAPAPAGAAPNVVQQYRAALEQQAAKYDKTASNFFHQCIQNGEKFQVFSQFVKGCQSSGKIAVDEAEDTKFIAKSVERVPADANSIRTKLYDKPRDINLYLELAKAHTAAQDFAMSQMILGRALEIKPNDPTVIARQGVNDLFMNNFDIAYSTFQKALKLNPNEATALWGIAGLYNEFHYSKRLASVLAKARRAGRPVPPLHPFVQALK